VNLGLGSSLKTAGNVSTPSIITDGLVLKSNFDTGKVTPISDGSASFDGSNDYITIADNSNLSFGDSSNDSAFSISAWVYVKDATKFRIIGKCGFDSIMEWAFTTDADDDLRLILYDATTANFISQKANAVLPENQWVHVACTYNANESASGITLYQDGAVSASTASNSGSYTALHSTSATIEMGRLRYSTSTTDYSDGNMCNVGIWSAALTAAQVKSIMYKNYSDLTTSETTNLVSWWNLSADANDNHGSNNGTLS